MIKNRLAVSIFFGMNGFLFANYISRLPQIQEMLGIDKATIGMILFSTALGALIAMPFTGWLIVGNGSKRITIISGFLLCLFVSLIGIMPHTWAMAILFFLIGLAMGMLDVSMNAQAVVVEQLYQRPIMTTFHAIFSAGMMVGAGAGALFTRWGSSLWFHLSSVSILALLTVLWAIYHLVQDKSEDVEQEESVFQLPKGSLIVIGLIAFCCMLGEGAMADWSTNYMLEVVETQDSIAPLGLAVFSFSMMIARFIGDKARTIVGDRKLLIICGLIALLGLGAILSLPHLWVALPGFGLIGLGLSVIVPIAYSIAGNTPDVKPGVGIGMVTTIGYAGFLLGPPVIGFLAEWQGLRIALTFIFLLFGLMVVLGYNYRPFAKSVRV